MKFLNFLSCIGSRYHINILFFIIFCCSSISSFFFLLETKPFQDLTNKTRDLATQSPEPCSEGQEEEHVHARRRRNPVNYKEPNLGT